MVLLPFQELPDIQPFLNWFKSCFDAAINSTMTIPVDIPPSKTIPPNNLDLTIWEIAFNTLSSKAVIDFFLPIEITATYIFGVFLCFLALVRVNQYMKRSRIRLKHHHSPALISQIVDGSLQRIGLLDCIHGRFPNWTKNFFYSTPWLINGDFQTIYAALTARLYHQQIIYERETIPTSDGGIIAVDWADKKPTSHITRPTMLLLHGLIGGSHEGYIQEMIKKLPHFQCVVFNFRGCNNSELLTPQLYSASFTQDLDEVVKYVRTTIGPESALFGCGYSLGANILLKYAGETSESCPFLGLVSVCNPFDLTASNEYLHKSWIKKKIYSRRLASNLVRVLKSHMHAFKSSSMYDMEKVLKSKTITEFDEHLTSKTFGFNSVHEYYHKGSCCHYLANIRVPTFCLNALDDPLIPGRIIPYSQIKANPWIILGVTRTGGHLGWYKNWLIPERWDSEPTSQFIIAVSEAYSSLPKEKQNKSKGKIINEILPKSNTNQVSNETKAKSSQTLAMNSNSYFNFLRGFAWNNRFGAIFVFAFLWWRSLIRKPSAIRSLLKYLSIPGMISLGGGNPHPSMFPFKDMSIRLKNDEIIYIPSEDMEKALQYSATSGLPEFVQWLKELQSIVHSPVHSDIEICIGNGSQEVLTKAFEMLIDPGDTILIEAPAYSGTLAFLRPLGCLFSEIPTDKDGLDPNALAETLETWPANKPLPKILYTVPIGGNPTGTSTTLERKKTIYQIAEKYDILILEDDPYYYLQFDEKIPSYFSFDSGCRVMRFDSLSKILSAGARIGWVTGPKDLVDRIVLHGQASNLHPSGISQTFIFALLKKWNHQGFLNHTKKVSEFYKSKRDMFLKSAHTHLTGLAEWYIPTSGMFVWIKILGIKDSAKLISSNAVEKKVLLVPGFEFYPNSRETNQVRAAYSIASEQEIDAGLERLGNLIKESQKN